MTAHSILKSVIWTLVFMAAGAVLFRFIKHKWPSLDLTVYVAAVALGGELFLLWREQRRLGAQAPSRE